MINLAEVFELFVAGQADESVSVFEMFLENEPESYWFVESMTYAIEESLGSFRRDVFHIFYFLVYLFLLDSEIV